MRVIGMDVHRSFAQIAVVEDGLCRDEGRIGVRPEDLRVWAGTLEPDDQIALEATTNSDVIAAMLRPLVARVVVSNPRKTRAIAEAKVKTDKVDARILAQLLAADFLPETWVADDRTRMLLVDATAEDLMPHITPLTDEDLPQYRDDFAAMAAGAGYVPNSFWTLGHRPQILDGLRALAQAVFSGSVDPGLKSLVAVMSSYGAGCRYCQAHQAVASLHRGVAQDKLDALASFEHSPLFGDADRAALRLAFASGQQPNGATAQHFDDLRHHFDEGELVEICAVIALFGFLNRWNETVATELEDVPLNVASIHLDGLRWEPGRHRSS